MDKIFKKSLAVGLMLFDFISLNMITPVLMYFVQYMTGQQNFLDFAICSGVVNLIWFSVAQMFHLYSFQQHAITLAHCAKVLLMVIFIWISFVVLFFLFRYPLIITFQYSLLVLTLFPVYLLSRLVYDALHHIISRQKGFISRAIIIGYNTTAKTLATYLQGSSSALQLVGYVEDAKNVKELSALPIFNGISNSIAIAKHLSINEIYSTLQPNEYPILNDLLKESEKACIRFHFVPNVSGFIERGMVVDHFSHLSVCSSRKDPLSDVGNRVVKRLFDVGLSMFVLFFILSWLYPLLAIIIKLSSKGPVLFKQERTGLSDKTFYCYKFRTMRDNHLSDVIQATRNDQRVTSIGSFLRKTSLDEFPQFINVLKGDMSVVGPRPHMLKHTRDFLQIEDQYMIRHLLKPGITGWAQVNGYRGEIKDPAQLQQRIAFDIWYLENWSLLLDVKIVLLTFLGVFKGDKNAY